MKGVSKINVLVNNHLPCLQVIKSMGINLKEARTETEKIIGRGSGFVAVEIPFTPRAKRVLELSLEEARQLGIPSAHSIRQHTLLICLFVRVYSIAFSI